MTDRTGVLPTVFDDAHYAGTFRKKLRRAFQLGPKYYLFDLPRYFFNRQKCRLSIWDPATLINPLREFLPKRPKPESLPPNYEQALTLFAEAGIRLTMPRERLGKLLEVWWRSRAVHGDVIECGAYQGATSLLIALLGQLNGIAQHVLMLDTFAGMPVVCDYDTSRQNGEFHPALNQVEKIHRQARILGVSDRIEVYQGLFTDTFPILAARDARFAFVHIDANIYQGTLDACQFTIPRIESGGVVVFDDYNGVCDLGARLAIDEFFTDSSIKPLPLTASSAYVPC